MNSTEMLLQNWSLNQRGDYVRDGYTITVNVEDNTRIIRLPNGSILEKSFMYFSTAIRYVNKLLDGGSV